MNRITGLIRFTKQLKKYNLHNPKFYFNNKSANMLSVTREREREIKQTSSTNKTNNNLCENKIMLNEVKMVVFDIAGTSVNEHGIVYTTLKETLEYFNIPYTDEEFNRFHGVNKREVLYYYAEKNNKKELYDNIVNFFEERLRFNYKNNNNIEPIRGVYELFHKLVINNVKVCLDTGYDKSLANMIIDITGLRNYISGFISSDQVKRGRPSPYMINNLMYQFDINDPKLVIKVGDTVADIKSGKNAGTLHQIGVLSGADDKKKLSDAGATIVIDSVHDLLNDKYWIR